MRCGRVVSHIAFEVPDSHRLVPHLEVNTLRLTLLFLRADTSANRRQCAALLDDIGSPIDAARLYTLDEIGYVNVHRAALYTSGVRAVETPLGLKQCLFGCETLVHLLMKGSNTHFGCQLVHLDTRDIGAFFGFHRRA